LHIVNRQCNHMSIQGGIQAVGNATRNGYSSVQRRTQDGLIARVNYTPNSCVLHLNKVLV